MTNIKIKKTTRKKIEELNNLLNQADKTIIDLEAKIKILEERLYDVSNGKM